ncbi:CD209 antigen-like protein C isoform X3 [Sebastes fasciatus]|uniref:CD209 antigen-like protein C isoform X3 n=1 Tax=Sebastes fasciatus TaxID=394691 RepID=UPI003D9DCF6C
MEEIYANVEYDKPVDPGPSTNPTGRRSSERRFHGAVVLCLGLLSVFLLAGLIGLSVHYSGRDADLSTINANLTERLQASDNKLSSVSAERDLLNASLTEMTKELDRLQSLSKEKKTCPAGWTMFSSACYLLSGGTGSWDRGREDCRNRGAHLVMIGSVKEQTFVAGLNKRYTWIGLNDKDVEGTWKWIDGTPLTLMNWAKTQPDNGGGDPRWGEEDCAYIGPRSTQWNDWSCETVMSWICEKIA